MPMYQGMGQNTTMPTYGNTAPLQNDMQNRMPYAYGMMNENPLPMQPSPISSLPPLFPSMLTPQLNPQAPFTSPNLMEARYAHGGQVHHGGLSHMAEMVREEGDEDDSILAHINPEEAHHLAHHFGMDMNPHTGLPQFGKFGRRLKKVVRKALPVIGALVGNALLPGAGAPVGGALAGSFSTKKPGKGALRGLGIGAGLGFGAPMLGKLLSGMGHPNVGTGLSQIGTGHYPAGLSSIAKAFGPGTGSGALGALGKVAPVRDRKGPMSEKDLKIEEEEGQEEPGIFANILGRGGLSNLLLPAALIGTAMRREKMKPAYEQPSFENVAAQAGPQSLRKMWGPEYEPQEVVPFQRRALPYEQEEFDITKPYYHRPYFEGYAGGGEVQYHTGGQVAQGGYIHGDSGGQDDNVHRSIPENSFIINATTVSHLGDGNSLAGAKKLDHFFHQKRGLSAPHFYEGGTPRNHVDAMVSEGEYEVLPHDVASLGRGDIRKGVKMLNNLQKNVLSHKSTKGLPPKAKSLTVYMSERSKRR